MIDENMKEKLLRAVSDKESMEKCLMEENEWQVLYHLSDIRKNLLEWYEFNPQASLLEVGAECGALTGLFCRKTARVVALEVSEEDAAVNRARNGSYPNLTIRTGAFDSMEIEEKFDYVTLIGVLATAGNNSNSKDPYMDLLKKAKACLKPGGRLILAIENKYGLKYFAGAAEDHTGRCFDGLENYVAAGNVRTFSHKMLDRMLTEAGFVRNQFYYPTPDDKLPSEIYSDRCLPSFGSIRYPSIAYDRNRYELIDERLAFDSICQDDMFGEFANAFLVISDSEPPVSAEQTVIYAKYNRQRAPEYQLATKIVAGKDGSRWVEKEALRQEAEQHIKLLAENRKKLTASHKPGMPIPVEIRYSADQKAVFPFVEGTSLAKEVNVHLGRREEFLSALHRAADSIYAAYLHSPEDMVDFQFTKEFETVFGIHADEQTTQILKGAKSLRVSNIDSILSNFIRLPDGRVICLDYEWVFTFPIPVEYLLYRTIYYYFSENIHYIKMAEQELWAEFHLSADRIVLFRQMDDHFQQMVHGKDRRYMYTSNYAKKSINIGKNMQIGESWFLSIADDIHDLNSHLGGERRDLVECQVKVHRKSAFLDRCEKKMVNGLRKVKNRLQK